MPGVGFWGRSKPPPGVPLDRGSDLARGLVFAFIANEGAGLPRDLISGNFGAKTGTPWVGAPFGPTLSVAVSGDNVQFPAGDLWGTRITGSVTLAIRFNPTTITSYMALVDPVNGSDRQFGIFLNTSTLYTMVGGNAVDNNAHGFSTGVWNDGVFVYDDVAHTFTVYTNGKQTDSKSLTKTAFLSAPTTFGSNPSGGGSVYQGKYGHALFWDRALTASEAALASSALYDRLFLPPVWRRYFVPAGGAAASGAALGRAGAQSQAVAAKAITAAQGEQAGTRAQAVATKAVSSASASQAGPRGQDVAAKASTAAPLDRAGSRGQAAAAKASTAAAVTSTGARAQCVGLKSVSGPLASRAGAEAQTVGSMSASGAAQSRAGIRSQTVSTSATGRSGSAIGQAGTRAQCSGLKGGVAGAQGSAGTRTAAVASKGGIGTPVGRAGLQGACAGLHGGIGVVATSTGLRGAAGATHSASGTAVSRLGARAQTLGGAALRRTITGQPFVRHSLTGVPLVRHTLSGVPV